MISIRPAVEDDNEAICSVDLIAQRENERRKFIRRVVIGSEIYHVNLPENVDDYH